MWWQRYEKRRNDDFIELMKWIMQLDAKLDEISIVWSTTMAKRRIPPEQFAKWAEDRRQLAEYLDRRRAELQQQEERHRRRLRILTLGLLGR